MTCDPEGCVVWSLVLLVGSAMAKWSQLMGQEWFTKTPMNNQKGGETLPGGSPGPRRRSPGCRVFLEPGRAQPPFFLRAQDLLGSAVTSGVTTDRTREAGSGDVDRHLTVGKGTGACEGGGTLPIRSGGAYLHAQSQLWNCPPR